MIKIKIITFENIEIIETDTGQSLLDILRTNGYNIYAPCGGKGTCGKCRVNIAGEGNLMSCIYYPDKNIEVILPEKNEANILVTQTEFLEDLPVNISKAKHVNLNPYGVAVDIGTTIVVLYFISMLWAR